MLYSFPILAFARRDSYSRSPTRRPLPASMRGRISARGFLKDWRYHRLMSASRSLHVTSVASGQDIRVQASCVKRFNVGLPPRGRRANPASQGPATIHSHARPQGESGTGLRTSLLRWAASSTSSIRTLTSPKLRLQPVSRMVFSTTYRAVEGCTNTSPVGPANR